MLLSSLAIATQLTPNMAIPAPNTLAQNAETSLPSLDEAKAVAIASLDVVRPVSGKTLKVGPNRTLRLPSDAAKIAENGDMIEIDAGIYHNDYAAWHQDGITLRGVGGMVHLKSTGYIENGKGIWIINGDDVSIENIEFSGAAVRDTNGAGIRHQGGNLTLHNTFFHHNEFSVLTGPSEDAVIDIQDSRFWHQKRKTRFSHGIYIGAVAQFRITGSHFLGTDKGHQIKSRARENHILYNRIEDVPQGTTSRLIDLPNCGLSVIMGNDLHQSASTHNVDAIGYGAEGCERRNERQKRIFVVNNTFINEANSGALLKNHAKGDALVANNLLLGRSFSLLGDGKKTRNIKTSLARRHKGDWAPSKGSKAIDRVKSLPPFEGKLLIPTKEFTLPAGTRPRTIAGKLDIGSRDFLPPGTPAPSEQEKQSRGVLATKD